MIVPLYLILVNFKIRVFDIVVSERIFLNESIILAVMYSDRSSQLNCVNVIVVVAIESESEKVDILVRNEANGLIVCGHIEFLSKHMHRESDEFARTFRLLLCRFSS